MNFSRVLVAGSMILCFALTAHSKEWYQLYEEGKKAIEKNNCVEGIKDINEALRKNPKPDLKARPYGTITLEYIPHFYLAKCALDRGDFAAAEMYLSEAQKADMYSSSKASEFRAMKKSVEDKIAQSKLKPSGSQQASNQQGSTTTTKPGQQQQQQQTVTQPTQADLQRQKEAAQAVYVNRTLQEARSAIQAGNYDEARRAANNVLSLDRENRDAQKILAQISTKETAEDESKAKQGKLDAARRALTRGEITTAESMILQLKSEYPGDSKVQALAQEIQNKKAAQMQTMKEADSRAMLERQVVRAYYEGKYEAVVQLADLAIEQHANSWRLYFFEGCAQAALGLMDESQRDIRLNQARQSFRKAREIVGDISQPQQISPKIWDVYKSS
jgi:hypothetical protein